MDDTFKIFVRRLQEGHAERISERLSCDFLDIHEAELAFESPIVVEGIAEVADGTLILRLAVQTEASMPCAVCNRDIQVKISIPDFCHTEALAAIKGGVFDYREVLREEILLALPYTAECNDGDCPERASLAKYFTKNT
jgi:uncharacterized metal-binding protein YceD (DUF177 family)